MPSADLERRGAHTLTVCNSCRYCEQYCPVFPAIERRLVFEPTDLAYLANLCHNCGECLYACQYAPPHEFGIDVPRTLAELRLASYQDYCWPAPLASAFRRQGAATALALSAGFTALLAALCWSLDPTAITSGRTDAAFYAVLPHAAMVATFGGVTTFVLLALALSLRRFWQGIGGGATTTGLSTFVRALRDGLTLRHLHATGPDCVSAEEVRAPWRRLAHHATVGGFALCFASTSVAALYHTAFGWQAPYAYTSLPVVLGSLGGIGLLAGPTAQWWDRRRRDRALSDPAQHGIDTAFLLLLWLTSLTGLLLLVCRTLSLMAPLLVVHLGVVLALFVTLPYGKFVHGFYRLLALVKDAAEAGHDVPRPGA
jgi:citrate/tricarballylate utilization protein